ncbi:hypothetical protein MUP51_01110 [Candidatus Bathyarchaeota archaeon]|jgi:hypothetical protein|nr:hypothetical protein [Candidatus Bathyarchaeota archaeon]
MYRSENEVFENKYIILLAITLLATYSIHQIVSRPESPALSSNNWFADEATIEDILRKNVDTNYSYLEVSNPHYTPSFSGGIDPFFAEYDIWYRYFNFYPFDPDSTPDYENYRIDGIIFIDGRIKIYGHLPADWYYI